MSFERWTALVLAGRRGGADDPLAEARAGRHRALIDVCGTPMLVRVVQALREADGIGRITVSIDEPGVLEDVPELASLLADGVLALHRSLDSPSRSVLDALDGPAAGERVLVTTADHALLRAEWVDHFTTRAEASDADVLVGVVAADTVRSRYPQAIRTFLQLRDGGWTGANLFAFRSGRARSAAAFWVRAEQFRKRPWRLVSVFGPATLVLFALRRLDLDEALARVSRAMGVRVRAVPLPFPEAAIDVDRPADLTLVTRILGGQR